MTKPTNAFDSALRSGRVGFGLLALLSAGALSAQTATPAAASKPADEDTVVLSPFTVSTEKDVGYRATNSIAGTRTNTPIKDIPINIQVFTKELAEDLVIKNQVDLEAYNASLVYGAADRFSDNVIQQPYQNFLFRGFRQNWGLRDGVREYDPIDLQTIARVEVVKGPAAALYGLAYPGGVMNNITKTAEFTRNFASLRLTAGSEGDFRGTIDANVHGNLAGDQKVAIRYNGAYEKTMDPREHSEGIVRLNAVAGAWKATDTTTLEFLTERGYRAKPNGLGWFQTSEVGASGNQASIPLQILHPDVPWTWNWANEINKDSLETKLYRGTITQRVGADFQVQGYYQYSQRLEVAGNGWDANGSGGANSWESAGSGWDAATNTITTTYNYRDWGNDMHAYGATGVYKIDFSGVKNTFAFGANVWGEEELSRHMAPPTTADALASAIIFPGKAGIAIPANPYPPATTVPIYGGGTGFHHENNSNDYYFLSWQASWLQDRLKTNIGVNKTNIKLVTWNDGTSTVPDNTYEQDQVSPLYGVVYDVTKEISLFGVHSTSLFPDSTKDSFGNQFAPQVGKSWEGGVKVDLLNGKITGTASYFDITQTGGTQNDPNKANINTLRYDALPPAQQQAQFGGIRPLGDIIAGGEQESKGFELDLTFQPVRELQIVTSYAHVDHQFTQSASPDTIGQTYPQAVKDRYAVVAKYSFLQGDLKNFAVGMGLSGGSKSLQDYQRRAANGGVYTSGAFVDVARYEPGRLVGELFGSYRFKLYNYNAIVQLNVKNLFETPDYQGWKATGSANVLATERYEVPTTRLYRLTFGLDF